MTQEDTTDTDVEPNHEVEADEIAPQANEEQQTQDVIDEAELENSEDESSLDVKKAAALSGAAAVAGAAALANSSEPSLAANLEFGEITANEVYDDDTIEFAPFEFRYFFITDVDTPVTIEWAVIAGEFSETEESIVPIDEVSEEDSISVPDREVNVPTVVGSEALTLRVTLSHPQAQDLVVERTYGDVTVTSLVEVAGDFAKIPHSHDYYTLDDVPQTPQGLIIAWSGPSSATPDGWDLCDGSNNTPDLRDQFIVGAGDDYNIGDTGGEEEVTLSVSQLPSHRHNYRRSRNTNRAGNNQRAINRAFNNRNTGSTGGSEPHNNMPPYYALAYIKKS